MTATTSWLDLGLSAVILISQECASGLPILPKSLVFLLPGRIMIYKEQLGFAGRLVEE
jgi:hypothetical protein